MTSSGKLVGMHVRVVRGAHGTGRGHSCAHTPVTLVCLQIEMINEYSKRELKKRKADRGDEFNERLSDLESSAKSSGPHEAVALQASAFPPVPTP